MIIKVISYLLFSAFIFIRTNNTVESLYKSFPSRLSIFALKYIFLPTTLSKYTRITVFVSANT